MPYSYLRCSKDLFNRSIIANGIGFAYYYFPIDKERALGCYLIIIGLLFFIKNILYIFHRDEPLPREWYYKILYICTLQILPLLAL